MLEQLHYEEELEIARITKALCLIVNKYNAQIINENNEKQALKDLKQILF